MPEIVPFGTIWALSALAIAMMIILAYFLIFFFIFFVIGKILIPFIRGLKRIIFYNGPNTL